MKSKAAVNPHSSALRLDIEELEHFLSEVPLDFNGTDFSEVGVELGHSNEDADDESYGFSIEDLSLEEWLYND